MKHLPLTRSQNTALARQLKLIARVARELGLSPSHVSRVWTGERRSPRVSAALRAAMQAHPTLTRRARRQARKAA